MDFGDSLVPLQLFVTEYSGWCQSGVDTPSTEANIQHCSIQLSGTPDASQIPAMLRRRLNLLGKACAAELLKHLRDNDDLPIVYCSRHGDIARSTAVLESLAKNEPVSPMHFSLAVHNAICGVVSIHKNITSNISTIASSEGVIPVLLEAAGLLADGHQRVLCVLCDTPLPDIYRDSIAEPKQAFACSFILQSTTTRASPDAATQLLLTQQHSVQDAANSASEPLQLIEFLGSNATDIVFPHNDRAWRISKSIQKTNQKSGQ